MSDAALAPSSVEAVSHPKSTTDPGLVELSPMSNIVPTVVVVPAATPNDFILNTQTRARVMGGSEDNPAESMDLPIKDKGKGKAQEADYSSEFDDSDNESEIVLVDQAEDDPEAIARYERTQEKQIADITSKITPLELVLGGKKDELCVGCFHLGHNLREFDICPAGRINSLFSENREPYYGRFTEKGKARAILMKDIAWACQGLSWAIQYLCGGLLRDFGIIPSTVAQLRSLIGRWKSVSHDPRFSYGIFSEAGGEITFGEPIQVVPIKHNRAPGPFKATLKPIVQTPAHAENSVREYELPIMNTKVTIGKHERQNAEKTCKRLGLEILGGRPNSVCQKCHHLGHAQSSVNICPYMIVAGVMEKLNKGRRKRRDITKEIECLEKVVKGMTEPKDQHKVEHIRALLAEWEVAEAKYANKGGKSHITPSDHLKAQVAMHMATIPTSSESLANPEMLQNTQLPLTFISHVPSQGQDQNFTDLSISVHKPITTLPVLESPFIEKGTSISYNEPILNKPLASEAQPKDLGFNEVEFFEPMNYSFDLEAEFNPGYDESISQNTTQNLSGGGSDTPMLNFPDSNTGSADIISHDLSQPLSQLSYDTTYSSQNRSEYDLPDEIFWRKRCPLKIIGNRVDNFCKGCLHYGHDKRSQSCLITIIKGAIIKDNLNGVLAASESIKALEDGVAWAKNVPERMQGDGTTISNLIRSWKAVVKSFGGQSENNLEADMDFPTSKRHCGEENETPVRQYQDTITNHQVQKDHGTGILTPTTLALQGQLSQTHLSHLDQSFNETQAASAPPKGWAIDYSRMDSSLFNKISDYIITDGDLADSDTLRVDNQRMPPMLIVAIRNYVLSEKVPQAPAPQVAARQLQQNYPLSHGSSPTLTHLPDIGQRYSNQLQTPKRKR